MDLLNNKYKEKSPLETVEYIKSILEGLGFELVVDSGISGVGSYWHRLHLYRNGVRVTQSGGKGNTEEFSLASAYAETMERIQSDYGQTYRQFGPTYLKDYLGVEDFAILPDEKKEYDIETHKKEDRIIQKYTSMIKDKHNKHHFENLLEVSLETTHETFGYIPLQKYQNLNGEPFYINEFFYREHIAGSTGLCAGNSKYEALLQGLCEIVERYTKYIIYKEDICLPIIPREHLTEYARQFCDKVNSTGRYHIEIRDASLGRGLPVICSILYDREARGYVVSFGSFPVWDVAVDRTINELLQYYQLGSVGTLTKFRSFEPYNASIAKQDYMGEPVDPKEYNKGTQYIYTNKNNSGLYKDKMLGYSYSYEFTPWGKELLTNEEFFYKMCSIVENEFGTEVLYKDYSFLGFPTYSVVCYELFMESFVDLNVVYMTQLINRKAVEQFIFEGTIDKGTFIKEFENNPCYANLEKILSRHLKYGNACERFLKGYVEFLKGNYEESSRLFMVDRPKFVRGSDYTYYRYLDLFNCFENCVGLKDSIKDEEEISHILMKIYNPDIVNLVTAACKDDKSLTKALFLDRDSELCLIDWERTEASLNSFKAIYNKKKEMKYD